MPSAEMTKRIIKAMENPHVTMLGHPTGRLLRDAKLYEIGAGTSEIRRMLIGRELFKDTA